MEVIAVDHVQFAVQDVAAGVRYLQRYGYEPQFHEPDFNSEERSYYRGIKKSMVYLRRAASRIEVITGTVHQGCGRYIPVFGRFASPSRAPALDVGEFLAFRHAELGGVCASGPGTEPLLEGVIVRASRPDRSSAFWQLLGFKATSADERYQTLAFPPNMLSMPLSIFIARVQPQHQPQSRVDDLGCSSIAMITRNLRADCAALERERYAVSETTCLCVNRRPLSICFAAGPSGELVELMEFGRAG